MNITNELINEIRNKNDIVEVISGYLDLTPKGKNFFGVCPFHDDHSPSMSVSPEKQIFTCFSCGASGNVFTFVADIEHIGFYDAVRLLGNRVGYKLDSSKVKKNKYEEEYKIYDLACKFYQNNINTALGKNAWEYLEKRHIDKETVKKFRIGLSINKVSLTDYLINKGYNLNKLIDLGISNENGTDLFSNRIMFPLYDLEGNVVAFSGRRYNTNEGSKYINTKETVIFKKGNILYNYHNARELLKKNDSIIVMEGFMDVIRASTVGITNCIATMGTALTKQNANLLKKMANNIVLCFDGDKAGEEATVSAINIFKELDVIPKIIRLPEDLDPDEYILEYGGDSYKNILNNPKSTIEFLMEQHKTNKNLNDAVDISKYINESLNDLVRVDDEILIDLTIQKLCAEYKVNYDIIKKKFNSLKEKELKIQHKVLDNNVIKKKKQTQLDVATDRLIYYMLKNDNVIKMVNKRVIFIPDEIKRELVNDIIYYYGKYDILNIADFISYIALNQDEIKLFNEIMGLNLNDEYNSEEIEDYIKVINSYPIKMKVKELNKKMKDVSDPIEKAKILSEILSLKGVKE